MRTITVFIAGLLCLAGVAAAQSPQDPFTPIATMSELMVSLVHPAANDILFAIVRPPSTDKEWIDVQRKGIVLAESGNLLLMRNRAADWVKDSKMLIDSGAAAARAARAKDLNALSAAGDSINASCVTCHKAYRPNVFPLHPVAVPPACPDCGTRTVK